MRSRAASIRAWDRKYQGAHPRWRGPSTHALMVPEGTRVLELGCGDGKTLRGLVGEGHETIALDFSRQALLSLRGRLGKDERAVLVEGDGSALPFASRSFQLVVAHHFLEHLEAEERRSSAIEVARVLGPGGTLSVRAFGREDMREGKGEVTEPSTYLREGIAYHYFQEEELKDLFKALTLDSVRTEVTIKRFAGELKSRVVLHASFHKGL
jgi:ubiquinone/menaquinone biosynthesis C-methylase UbiE